MCVGNYNPQTCVWGNYNPEKAIQPPAPTQSDCGLSLMARRQPPPEHHSLMSGATQCVRLQRNSVGVWLGWLRWIKRQNSKHGKGHLDRHLCHLYKSLLKSGPEFVTPHYTAQKTSVTRKFLSCDTIISHKKKFSYTYCGEQV